MAMGGIGVTRRFITKKEIERQRQDPKAAHLHWMDRVYCNAQVVAALVSTAPGRIPTGFVALEPLDATQEVAVDWVEAGTRGAIKVQWGRTEQWLEFDFTAMLERHKGLAVEYGWIRRLPFRIADGRFILFLGVQETQRSVPWLRSAGLLEGWKWK
jgi:hypothetical protein